MFCGAFAADGIKGSVISGKESAKLIELFLRADKDAPSRLLMRMNAHAGLIHYYKRQLRYRWIWDLMKSNRTFRAMYDVIEREQSTFLDQFCDSKDTHRSLSRTVLKPKHFYYLMRYAWFLALDCLKVGLSLTKEPK